MYKQANILPVCNLICLGFMQTEFKLIGRNGNVLKWGNRNMKLASKVAAIRHEIRLKSIYRMKYFELNFRRSN